MSEDLQKTERALWKDYLFLTQEMTKCLARDDFPLFEELVSQRERLQPMIEASQKLCGNDTGFSSEQDRKELLLLVQTANGEVQRALRLYYNERKNHSDAAMAYEGLDNPLIGIRMDEQR